MLAGPSVLLVALFVPAVLAAHAIQRCEAPGGRISYSDADCPAGSRIARVLPPARQPDAAARKEARERLQRYQDLAESLASQRQQPAQSERPAVDAFADEVRKASDCAYLRAELDASRRLRDLLTTRRYYSYDHVEQAEARMAQLADDHQRFCGR